MSTQRLLRIAVLLLALVGLSVYGKMTFPYVTLRDCLRDPQRFDGTKVAVATETVVHGFIDGGFTIQQMGRIVPVIGDTTGIQVGEFIHLTAIFRQPGVLELQKAYVAKYRRLKIAVSLFSAVAVLVLFFSRFALRRGQFVQRRRHA